MVFPKLRQFYFLKVKHQVTYVLRYVKFSIYDLLYFILVINKEKLEL